MPTMVADVTPVAHPDQTYIDLADELPTDPRQHGIAPAFAPPPPVTGSPFAAPPPKDALDRQAQHKPWSRALGDGGPPVGLDLLVMVLIGVDIMSMGVWWRSNVPIANAMILPLMATIVVKYFFWKGNNWARFLIILGSLVEIVGLGLGFAMLRRHLTGVELVLMAFRLLLDGWVCYFSIRPDTVAFFERRRR